MRTATEVFRRHRELGVPDLVECPACRCRSGPSLRDFEADLASRVVCLGSTGLTRQVKPGQV
jgi:hypothetical protein